MQKRDIESPADATNNELEDDDIIKLAEELLEDENSDILELGENQNLDDEEEDIIDLTEVAETQLQGDDDILDLTEDIEISVDGEDDYIDLEELPDVSMDAEETLSGLDDGRDNLTFLDDAVVDLDDVAEEIRAVEQNRDDLEDTVDGERLNAAEGLMRETDTIELTEADRKALEAEFGYERPIEGLTDPEANETLTSSDVEEEILLDFNDDTTEEILEEVDLAADLLEDQPEKSTALGEPHEKLELSEADRRILEEELSFDTDEAHDPFPIDDSTADEEGIRNKNDEEDNDTLSDPLDTFPRIHTVDSIPSAAQESSGQLTDMPESDIERDGFTERAFGTDINDQASAPIEIGGGEQAIQDDSDPLAGSDDAARETGISNVEGVPETIEAPEDFTFDFDETLERPVAENDEMDFPPLTDEEERSVANLLAETGSPENSKPSQKFEPTERAEPGGDTEEVGSDTPLSAALMASAKIDADSENGVHRVEGPITIYEKETITPYRTDETQTFGRDAEPDPVREEISPDRLEAAVEKAVSKILSDRIESMLFEAIDRAVTKEISRLKALILGDHDPQD